MFWRKHTMPERQVMTVEEYLEKLEIEKFICKITGDENRQHLIKIIQRRIDTINLWFNET